ncbi:MAG: response regulator [Rhodospirillales bacterium]|jgi:CheY-like chemotaxis protein|nr:response regulator [Rhodospirillales bacterium]
MPTLAPKAATILVVDDDPQVREIVSEILGDFGHTVVAAGGGVEALRLLDETPAIDLVITDVRMPDISGLELASRAQRERADLKVILISGYFLAADVGLTVLRKPFRMSELQAAVDAELAA